MVIVSLVFSFFFEGIISNFIPINTYFLAPLTTLMSLLIIYPFFYNDDKNFLMIVFFTGIVYDLVYTNTLLFHGLIFLFMGLIIKKLNVFMSNNTLNTAFMGFILIIIYRFISYILFIIVGYGDFNIVHLLYSIASSLIFNMIYVAILYMVIDYMSKKLHIKKID